MILRKLCTILPAAALLACVALPSVALGVDGAGDAWGRDPFFYGGQARPAPEAMDNAEEPAVDAEPPTSPARLNFQGVVLHPDGRYRAILDGRELAVGDAVGDLRIVGISRFAITVDDGATTRELDLFHNQVKWGDR